MKNYPEDSYLTAKIEIPWHPGEHMEVKVLGTKESLLLRGRMITQIESLDESPVFPTAATGGFYMSCRTEVFTDKIIEVIVRDVDGNEIDNLGKPPGKDVLVYGSQEWFDLQDMKAETNYEWMEA